MLPARASQMVEAAKTTLFSGRYQAESFLGEGSFSYVFKARDTRANHMPVAVKMLKMSGHDEPDIKRFWSEVSITQTLDHPHIVRVLSSGTWHGNPYLVMEYLSGGTLRDFLEAQPGCKLPFMKALTILHAVSSALEHAHSLGAVHRDVKPENILLGQNGEVKVVDFGVAHQRALTASDLTGAYSFGTPVYMPPEQFRGDYLGPEIDVYALGILAYEMLMGRAPFGGESFAQLLYQHCEVMLPRDAVEEAGVPCWFEGIIVKATKKNHKERYPTAKQFRSDLLRNARKELGVSYFDSLINFLRPNGVLCTRLRLRGWSRKQSGAVLLGCLTAIALLIRLAL